MEPSPELQDLTRHMAEAIGTAGVSFLERHTSRQDGVCFLGTDPDEWWTDLAGLARTLQAQGQAGVTVIPGDPVAYQEGAVGWAVDRSLRFRVGDQEIPFRFSVIYHREDGEWKMVHFHTSIGVSNEEAVGVALPMEALRDVRSRRRLRTCDDTCRGARDGFVGDPEELTTRSTARPGATPRSCPT